MRRCVKCGGRNALGAGACSACKWPLIYSAWSSAHLIRRITLDTCCVNAGTKDDHLNQLERWAQEGKLHLERTPALLQELKGHRRISKAQQIMAPQPPIFTLDNSVLGGGDVLAGPDLPNELRQILFPTAKQLTSNQQNDIEHLRQHVRTGGDVFVTLNQNDFITRGRQAELASFGIWALLPNETVRLLGELYGWA